jgi:hypothetical protein
MLCGKREGCVGRVRNCRTAGRTRSRGMQKSCWDINVMKDILAVAAYMWAFGGCGMYNADMDVCCCILSECNQVLGTRI